MNAPSTLPAGKARRYPQISLGTFHSSAHLAFEALDESICHTGSNRLAITPTSCRSQIPSFFENMSRIAKFTTRTHPRISWIAITMSSKAMISITKSSHETLRPARFRNRTLRIPGCFVSLLTHSSLCCCIMQSTSFTRLRNFRKLLRSRNPHAFRYEDDLIRLNIFQRVNLPARPANLEDVDLLFFAQSEVNAQVALRDVSASSADFIDLLMWFRFPRWMGHASDTGADAPPV